WAPALVPGLILDVNPAAAGVLWQDDAGTLPATADGSPVGKVTDGSPAGNHLIQATADARPVLKLAIVKGLPVLRFDGLNDYLLRTLGVVKTFTEGALWAVVARASTSGNRSVFDARRASNETPVLFNLQFSGGTDAKIVQRDDAGNISTPDLTDPALSTFALL